MGTYIVRAITAAGLAMALSGHAQAEERRLQVKQGLCIEMTEANGRTAIEVAEASLSCFAEGKLEQGLELFAAVELFEWYDEKRMKRHFSVSHINDWVSRELDDIIVDDLGLDSTLRPKHEELTTNRRWMRQLCENISKLDPPRYWPDYLDEIDGPAPDNIPVHPELWRSVVRGGLCPS